MKLKLSLPLSLAKRVKPSKNPFSKIYQRYAIFIACSFFTAASIAILIGYFLLTSGTISFANDKDKISVIIILLMVSAVLGTLIACLLGRALFKTVLAVSRAMQKVAEGDFSVRVKESKSNSEFANLARNYNLMAEELSNTEMLRSDFVVSVSHEFKTPLAGIQNCATLLDDDSLTTDERHEYGKMLRESADYLLIMCTNILRLSKIENVGILTDKKAFSLDEQLRQNIIMLEPKWAKKDLTLNIDLEKCLVNANPELLSQVFINILENAIKFSSEGSSLDISLSTLDGFANINVTDHGIGMNKETLSRIFDKFYQADTSHKSEGNGLGLVLVKKIVDLHYGSIDVRSAPGEGTSFTVTIPLE